MSLWWQIWGIGIIQSIVLAGMGIFIFVFVKLRNTAPVAKYRQNNKDNKSNSSNNTNQASNHKKIPNNSRIVCKPISQDSRDNSSKDKEYHNRKDKFPVLHSTNTISKVKSHVNHNREEPTRSYD